MAKEPEQPGGLRVLRTGQVTAKIGVNDNVFYGMLAKRQFPAGFQIAPGGRALGWLEGTVDEWIKERETKGLASMTPASDDDVVEEPVEFEQSEQET